MEAAILPYIPSRVSLYYVDYQDDLDEHEDLQQKCLKANNLISLYEKADDWYWEQETQNCEEELDSIRKKMSADNHEKEFDAHK